MKRVPDTSLARAGRTPAGPRQAIIRRSALSAVVALCVLLGSSASGAPGTSLSTRLPVEGFRDLVVDYSHARVFVTGDPAKNSSVVVLDFRGKILKVVRGLPGAAGMALGPKSSVLYVALMSRGGGRCGNGIAAIDPVRLRRIRTIPLPAEAQAPHSLAWTAGRLWFGYACGGLPTGIGSLNPSSGRVRLFKGDLILPSVVSDMALANGGRIGSDREQAIHRYRAFVRAGPGGADPKAERLSEIYLADKSFVRRRTARTRRSLEVPRAQCEPIRCSLEDLLRRRSDDAVALAYREHGYRLREIAAKLGVHYSTVSRRLKAQEQPPAEGAGAAARPTLSLLRCKT